MKSILKEIQSGKFAKEWVKEYQAGLPKYNKLLEDGENIRLNQLVNICVD